MIRPLRRRHLGVVVVLALAVPAVFAAGIGARAPMPTATTQSGVEPTGRVLWESDSLWGPLPVTTSRLAGGPPPGGDALELLLREGLERPDLLLYWSPGGAGEGTGVPDDARLVGSVGGAGTHRFAAPEGFREVGDLLLYSLGHQERVGRAALGGTR